MEGRMQGRWRRIRGKEGEGVRWRMRGRGDVTGASEREVTWTTNLGYWHVGFNWSHEPRDGDG